MSTTETGHMALTKAAKEGIWLRGLVYDLSQGSGSLQDNQTNQCQVSFSKKREET